MSAEDTSGSRGPAPASSHSHDLKAGLPRNEAGSVNSSPRSTHSVRSVDTTEDPEIHGHVDELPPPAYTPRAPANERTWLAGQSLAQGGPQGYGTIPVDPVETTNQTEHADNAGRRDEEDLLPSHRHSRRRKFGRIIKTLMLVVCLFLLLTFVLSLIGQSNKSNQPTNDDDLDKGVAPTWPRCDTGNKMNVNSRSAIFDFRSVNSFSLYDDIRGVSVPQGLDGKVNVIRAPSQQDSDVKVVVSMESTDYGFLDQVYFAQSDEQLIIEVAEGSSRSRHERNADCTVVNVLLMVKEGLNIENLELRTRHFSVEMLSNLELAVRDKTMITAQGGCVTTSVNPESFHSSSVTIHTTGGMINGTLPFDEALNLQTTSGNIRILVQGTAHDGFRPPHANFTARSTEGNINIDFPRHSPQKFVCANCRIDVRSTSGSISGHFIQGAHTQLESVSGPINGTIQPFDRYSQPVHLDTVSLVNRTNLQILPSRRSLFGPMKNMLSTHKTLSGEISVSYPEQWEGFLYGNTLTGKINIHGAHIERKTPNYIRAVRGEGRSKIDFRTVNGNVNITIGSGVS